LEIDEVTKGMLRKVLGLIAVAVIGGILAGCASDPRYSQGLDWIVYNEREKVRLTAMGFPQYSRD
jgi:hypothetical protein